MSDEAVKNVILAIADISGYTQFIFTKNIEIEHSQYIISQLIESIIQQITIPLQTSKLEGDAVFLYATTDSNQYSYEDVRKEVGEKLLRLFTVFHEKLREINETHQCDCRACTHMDVLKLKIVVHCGEAYFYQINQFNELSGKDVILLHRLLKNSVSEEEYILMTDAAYSDIKFPVEIKVREGTESYEHLGKIKTLTYCYHPL